MFMYPIFITDDDEAQVPLASMPGQCRWGVNKLEGFLAPLVNKGLSSVILFGVPLKTPKVCIQTESIQFNALVANYTHVITCYPIFFLAFFTIRMSKAPLQTIRRDR